MTAYMFRPTMWTSSGRLNTKARHIIKYKKIMKISGLIHGGKILHLWIDTFTSMY